MDFRNLYSIFYIFFFLQDTINTMTYRPYIITRKYDIIIISYTIYNIIRNFFYDKMCKATNDDKPKKNVFCTD